MAAGWTTHLTNEEVARETLARFDAGEFSMRALGARLNVSPAAFYNHFENQSAVVQAAVSLGWDESIADFLMANPGTPLSS